MPLNHSGTPQIPSQGLRLNGACVLLTSSNTQKQLQHAQHLCLKINITSLLKMALQLAQGTTGGVPPPTLSLGGTLVYLYSPLSGNTWLLH